MEAHNVPEREIGVAGVQNTATGQPGARKAGEDSVVEASLRAMSRQAPVPTTEARKPNVEMENTATAHTSSNLVQEVLAVDMEDDIYSLLEEDDSDETRTRGRKSRRDKREKHFFWE